MKFKLNFGFILLSLLLNTNSTYSQSIPLNGIIQGLIISETDSMLFEDNKYWLKFLPVFGIKWEIGKE